MNRKFLGVGMQQIMSRPSRSIRNHSQYCFAQKKSTSITRGNIRYFFSGKIYQGNQPIKAIPDDHRIWEIQKLQQQKNLNQPVDEKKKIQNNQPKNQKDNNKKKNKGMPQTIKEWLLKNSSHIISVSSIFASITSVFLVLWININKNDPKQIKYQLQLLQQESKKKLKALYGEQKLQFSGFIDSKTQIKDQIKKVFEHHLKQISDLKDQGWSESNIIATALNFEIITGISGSGKTTAIKQLLQQYRRKGKKAYYLSLKGGEDSFTPTASQVIQSVKILKSLLFEISKEATLDNVPIIVLDDINYLTMIKEDKQRIHNIKNYFNSIYKLRVKVFGISSSSDFYEIMKQDSKMIDIKFNVLQPLSWDDRRKMLASAIRYQLLVNTVHEDLLNYMMENGYFPRLALSRLLRLDNVSLHRVRIIRQKPQTEFHHEQQQVYMDLDPTKSQQNQKIIDAVIQKLKVMDEQQVRQNYRKIDQFINQQKIFANQRQKGKALDKLVVEKIIEKNQKIDDNNCHRIFYQIENQMGINSNNIKSFFEKLDAENLLIFCRPQTKIEWQAFARFLRTKYKVESEYVDYEKKKAEEAKSKNVKSEAEKQEKTQ